MSTGIDLYDMPKPADITINVDGIEMIFPYKQLEDLKYKHDMSEVELKTELKKRSIICKLEQS